MNRRLIVFLLIAALGCHEEGDGADDGGASSDTGGVVNPPPPNPTVELHDDFSGGFPGSNWILDSGSPSIVSGLGDPAPSLQAADATADTRLRSGLTFPATAPFTLSFDLAIPAPKGPASRFDLRLQAEGAGLTSASLVVPETAGVIRVQVGATEEEIPFTADGAFHTFTLAVDADRIATWSIDGGVVITVPDFPQDDFRLEILSHADTGGPFLVDNVNLSRPAGSAD